MPSRTGLDLETGERLHYRGGLRSGDEIAVTDRRVLVRGADETTSVPYTNVSEISNESFDWFLTILSLALVGFGLYSIGENAFIGIGMTLFGLWSVYRTYRHRDRVRIHTHSQAKPVEVFPEEVEALYDELEPAIEAVRAEQERAERADDERSPDEA
ncbi:hypothetical protein HYG81_22970 (plasmid) [Natrinema zhouii]|uniref:hypothetical protein n=1 Tax=Natrinema zhouii TaxID=1710539 RepID=UPI001CFF9E67|nr:hypothetical protein [Natrinema zhouii]UHQ98452.1 hypothetical protein HYG81_22970 [Natrinema zhouii]